MGSRLRWPEPLALDQRTFKFWNFHLLNSLHKYKYALLCIYVDRVSALMKKWAFCIHFSQIGSKVVAMLMPTVPVNFSYANEVCHKSVANQLINVLLDANLSQT